MVLGFFGNLKLTLHLNSRTTVLVIVIIKREDEKFDNLDRASTINMEQRVPTEIIPFIIGVIGTITKRLATFIDRISISNIISSAQTTVRTSTTKILLDILSL